MGFAVLAAALILAPCVAVLGQRLDWHSPASWALRAGLLLVAVVAVVAHTRLQPQEPAAPTSRLPDIPTRELIALPRPAEPARHRPAPATACRICGRPLKDPTDQDLGVDNACYVRHGARRVYVDNPDHAQWVAECEQLEHRQRELQADADLRHQEAMARWQAEHGESAVEHRRAHLQWLASVRAHDAYLRTPAAQARVEQARNWRTAAAGALGLLVLALL